MGDMEEALGICLRFGIALDIMGHLGNQPEDELSVSDKIQIRKKGNTYIFQINKRQDY